MHTAVDLVAAPARGVWQFVAAVYNAHESTGTLVVDAMSFSAPATPSIGHQALRVGSNVHVGTGVSALIDDVFVYDVALTSDELGHIRSHATPDLLPPVAGGAAYGLAFPDEGLAFVKVQSGPRSSSSPQGGELSIGIWVKSSVMVGESWVRSALVDKSGAGLPAEYYLGLYRAADDDLAKVEVRIGAGDSVKGTWLDVWEVRLDYARAASPMPASCVARV